MTHKLKVILIPTGIVVALVIAVVLGWLLVRVILGEKCDPFTPLTLEKFRMAGGEKPLEGEKCEISKKSYLLIITYDSSSDAKEAKKNLELATTPGDKDKIDRLNWITDKGSSAIFWTESDKLGILVAPDEDNEKALEKELKKARKKLE